MSKIRVLPVYPEFPDTFWGYKHALPFVGRKSCMPPTGLLTVMAMLPEEQFDLQRAIDLNVEPLTDEDLRNTDLVFTSSMIIQGKSHARIIDRAHSHGKKVVAGGPWVTSYPEENRNADYLVTGEAEITLPPFLEDFLNGTPRQIYTEKDVSGRSAELTVGGKTTLRNTPIPRWDLINLRDYFSAAIQYSRGCPFDCDFCDITKLFGKEPRTKSPEQMIAELNALYDRGHRGPVFIVDDNFIGNRANVKKLLPAITEWQIKRDYPFELFTEASMNLAWPENSSILEEMVKAGFNQVFVGIESIDNDSLKKMGKKQNLKLPPLESVRTIQRAGIEVMGGFIIGSDGEKPDSFEELFKFIQKAGIVVAMPGLLTALKGTDLYDRLKGEGRLRGESTGNNTHQLDFNFTPEQDKTKLLTGYKELLKKLFDPKNFYDRGRVLQENLGSHRRTKMPIMEGVTALGKSLRSHLFAEGGWQYAKYLTRTALTNPGYLPIAVSQAVKGGHFRIITRAMLEADKFVPLCERLSIEVDKISERSGGDTERAHGRLYKTANRVIKTAEREYTRLHQDFRDGPPKRAIENLREKVSNISKR